jgi:hypothetical protein
LPAGHLLVAIIRIVFHDEVIDAVKVEFAVRGVHNSLCDQLGVTKLGFHALVIVMAKVDAA